MLKGDEMTLVREQRAHNTL